MNKLAAHILVLALILAPLGCRPKSPSGLPVTTMQIGPEHFNVEIAVSPHDQEVGLMHRESLDPDHGMIFISPADQPQTYWNHDVHFPLDLIFLDSSQKIVSLKHMDAYSDKIVSSDAPAKYVIELNAGAVARLKLNVGDHIPVPNDALNPPSQ